ncbi:MAG TPA: tetratricopeptide repeat protein, partial [Myxococcota bacterium]|nr:tetratricopeptide repeat protein [Myxococcota bacterium]
MTLRIARLVLGLAVVLALGPIGCASDEEKVAAHIEAAEKYQEAKDFRSALVELRAALSIEPKNADLNLRIADNYQAMGRPQAGFFYGEAYRLDKSLTRAALMQVPMLYGSDPDAALALVEEVIAAEPTNVDAYTRRAEVLLVKNDTEGALAAALTGIELDPTHVNARRMVTSVYRARIRQDKLLEKVPGDEIYEKAIAAADTAAEVSKGQEHFGPWFDRLDQALIYGEWKGHDDEAEKSIREAFRLAQEADDRAGIQTVTHEARRIAAGHPNAEFRRWALERWVDVDPSAVQGWRRLAALERELGGSSDEVWARALAQRPDDVALHAEYVRVLLATHQPDRAFEYLASVPPSIAALPDMKALAFELRLDRGELDKAKEQLDALKAEHPDDPLTKLSEAAYDLQTGKPERGLETLRMLSGQVERADVLRQLALAESRMGNLEAALGAIDRAIELQPGRAAQAHQLRLRLLAAKGDWLAVLRGWRDMRKEGFPSDPTSTSLRIQALYELGRRETAKPLLEAALKDGKLQERDILLFNKYEARYQQGRAEEMARKTWEQDKTNVAFTRLLVHHALSHRDMEEALRILDENRKLTGRSADPIRHARTMFAMGRKEDAEALAIETFESKPRPFGASPLLVEILGARGKSDVAVAMLEKSRAEQTLQPAGLWQLGRIYYELGEYAKAQAPLEEAIAANPDFSPAISDLALVLAERGQELDRAVTLARKVKSQNPENSAIADTLGYVYLKKGLAEPAAFEFRSAIELAKVSGREVAE